MKIEIVTGNVESAGMIREFMQRKVQLALERLDAGIERVVIRLENAPAGESGFADQSCQIDAWWNSGAQVNVFATGRSSIECVLQAVRELETAIRQECDKKRTSVPDRHQKTNRSAS